MLWYGSHGGILLYSVYSTDIDRVMDGYSIERGILAWRTRCVHNIDTCVVRDRNVFVLCVLRHECQWRYFIVVHLS